MSVSRRSCGVKIPEDAAAGSVPVPELPDDAVLASYFAGEGEPAVEASIRAWVGDDARRRDVLGRLRDGWDGAARGEVRGDVQGFMRALGARIEVEGEGRLAVRRARGGRLGTRTLRRMLWSAAGGVAAGILGFILGWHGEARQVVQHPPRPVSAYATTNGERATITLLDGTTVSLGVASRLDVPAEFAAGSRTVHLIGEALFSVSHHTSVPFTVVAGPATTRVLGTVFSVRHYATDSLTTVAVQEGRVAVGSTVLTAQRLVEVGRQGILLMQPTRAEAFSFATGTLSLRYMRLIDAIPELDRWFDVDLRLGNASLAERHIKGEFAAGSLAELTSILELTFGVRVVRDGRVLTLYSGYPK